MKEQLSVVLKAFYNSLEDHLALANKKIQNQSILWTIISVNAKLRERLISESSKASDKINLSYFEELSQLGYIQEIDKINNPGIYTITALGIWTHEKLINDFSEETLVQFIHEKYFSSKIKSKPFDDKDKVAILSLIGIRCFSEETQMDLNSSDQRDDWEGIFQSCYDFLLNLGCLNYNKGGFDDFIPSSGSEHPIQNLMRHRNELSIKSNYIFINPGRSKYYLNISENGDLDENKIKYCFKLVFEKIDNYSIIKEISEFLEMLSSEKSKYVLNKRLYNNIDTDFLLSRLLKDFYTS